MTKICAHKHSGMLPRVGGPLCKKPATKVVLNLWNQTVLLCGIHGRFWKSHGYNVQPIKAKP